MKRWRFLTLTLLLSTVVLARTGSAQEMTSEALDVRNRLESEIQRNLLSLISTQLDPKLFTVAVRVKVAPLAPAKGNEQAQKEGLPAGMDLGTIDVRELLNSYDREIETLKLRQEYKKDEVSKFQITSLDVNVGLDESFDQDYEKKFSTWLVAKMKFDYGTIASSKVTRVQLKNAPVGDASKDAPTAGSGEAPKPNYLPVIAAGLIALSLLCLGYWLKSGLQQVAMASKNLSIEPRGRWAIEGSNAADGVLEPEVELLDGAQVGGGIGQGELDRLASKIAFVCMEINSKINDLVRVWIDSGDAGFLKTALLIDTLVTARERIMNQTGALASLRIPLDEELASSREENLAEAYRSVAMMPEHEKISMLEQIYWDLVSVRTLGLQSLRRPFDFLQGLPKNELIEILGSQSDDARALALVYLSKENQGAVLNEYDENGKAGIIKTMLAQSQIAQKSIWDIDTAVKVSSLAQPLAATDKLVNLFPRTVETLRSLSIVDEIRILRRVAPQLPDAGRSVKQQYVSLAFIDEWKPEYIRKLTQGASADELLTLIRQIPSVGDRILDECPPKLRVIIEDDLKVTAPRDEAQESNRLGSLRNKWMNLVAAENLSMSKVLAVDSSAESNSEGARRVA